MPFVLLHGGGLDSRCWDAVAPLLNDMVCAVDLPGRGSRPADFATVTVADFVDEVVAGIVDRDLSEVALVGHSLAGITMPGVALRVPDRLRRLVFVSCAVPPDGGSVAEILATFSPAVADLAARIGDGVVDSHGALHPDLATAMFCNDMNEHDRALTLSLLVPESFGVIAESIDLRGLRGSVPSTYVRLLRDASLTLELQNRMAINASADEVVDIDAGHMVMITRPTDLAKVLNKLSSTSPPAPLS